MPQKLTKSERASLEEYLRKLRAGKVKGEGSGKGESDDDDETVEVPRRTLEELRNKVEGFERRLKDEDDDEDGDDEDEKPAKGKKSKKRKSLARAIDEFLGGEDEDEDEDDESDEDDDN